MVRGGEHPVGGLSGVVETPETVPAPIVLCPFPARISPHAAKAQRYAVGWATRHGFLHTPREQSAFASAKFAYLMARAYPEASHSDLCLAVAWLTFTFMLDDHLETALGREPERQRELTAGLLGYLRDEHSGGPGPSQLPRPLASALVEVWSRTVTRTDRPWQERFAAHVADYLAANAWEADNRSQGRVPPIAEYVMMRRHSAATAMFFDLTEALGQEAQGDSPVVRRLRGHADNVVAWFNDLVSWPKEVAGGDPHNLVLVVRHELGLSLADAVRYVVERHNEEVRAFVAGRDAVGARLAGVQGVVDGLACWIRANVDWSRESGRYAPPDQA